MILTATYQYLFTYQVIHRYMYVCVYPSSLVFTKLNIYTKCQKQMNDAEMIYQYLFIHLFTAPVLYLQQVPPDVKN